MQIDSTRAKTVVTQWLYSPRGYKYHTVRAQYEWGDSTHRTLPAAYFQPSSPVAKELEFLSAFKRLGTQLDVTKTVYYQNRLKFHSKPLRAMVKLQRRNPSVPFEEAAAKIGQTSPVKAVEFIEMVQAYNQLKFAHPLRSLDEVVAERARADVGELIAHFEQMPDAQPDAHASACIDFVHVPRDVCPIFFSPTQCGRIDDGDKLPYVLIAGRAALASALCLGVAEIPVVVHTLAPKVQPALAEKWYHPREQMLRGETPADFATTAALLSHLAPGRTVLDVGANAGLVSLLAAKHGAASVIGLEPNEAYLQQARGMLTHWRAQGFLSADASVRFVQGKPLKRKELFDESNLFMFLKVLYHISTSRSETEEPSAQALARDPVVRIFGRLQHRIDAIIIVRGNVQRTARALRERSPYGNRFAVPEYIISFLEQFQFESIQIDHELVVAKHRDSAFDLAAVAAAVIKDANR